MTLDSERMLVFAAFSCSSVIAFDISVPATPTVWAVRRLPGHMVFQVSLAPGTSVYIGLPASEDHDRTPNATRGTAIGTGMGVLDASTADTFASGRVSVLPVAWSAIAQTTRTDRSRLIVADGVSGLFSLRVSIE